jgi:hypothetical protein
MLESEVQPLVPFIRCCVQILNSLLGCHSLPLSVTLAVTTDVIGLDERVQYNVHANNRQELFVTTVVIGRIVGAVNVGTDDTGSLDEHVVASCGDGSAADSV